MTPTARPPRRPAFTLVEVLIGSGVMLMVVGMLYTMMNRGSGAAVQGIWRGQTQKRLQTAAERLRKALEGASYPSVLMPEYNVLDKGEDHYIVVGPGTDGQKRDLEITADQDAADAAGEGSYRAIGPGRLGGADGTTGETQLVLAATNCVAARNRIAGLPDQQGKATHYYFWLANPQAVNGGERFGEVMELRYAERVTEYSNASSIGGSVTVAVDGHPLGDPPGGGKILVSDVNSVRIRVLDKEQNEVSGTTDPDAAPFTIELAIRCVERTSGTAVLGKVITVRTNTGVRL